MKKGIVMEINNDHLIMMTPEGEFLKGKKIENYHYTVGVEHSFQPFVAEKSVRSSFLKGFKLHVRPLVTYAIALLLIFTLLPSFLFQDEVYAYVSIDINPSFELSIDQEQEVVDIEAYNKDAERLLNELSDWKKKPIDVVTIMIIENSEKLGYLEEKHTIRITSVFTNEASENSKKTMLDTVEKLSKAAISDKDPIISYYVASEVQRKQALDHGVTVGTLITREKEAEEQKRISEPKLEEEQDELVKKENLSTGEKVATTIPSIEENPPNQVQTDKKNDDSKKTNNDTTLVGENKQTPPSSDKNSLVGTQIKDDNENKGNSNNHSNNLKPNNNKGTNNKENYDDKEQDKEKDKGRRNSHESDEDEDGDNDEDEEDENDRRKDDDEDHSKSNRNNKGNHDNRDD